MSFIKHVERTPVKTGLFRRCPAALLALAIVICLISSVGGSLIKTNFGSVRVEKLKWETPSGHTQAAQLFIPETATPSSPAPAVVTCHGWTDNSELQEMNNIELSRRGYVVVAIDMYGHGDSDDIEKNSWWNEENAGNGLYDGVKLAASLPYVDQARIGITGHSNGGYACNITTLLDNKAEQPLISAVLLNCSDALYTENILYGEYFTEADTAYTNWYGSRDVGIIAAQKEEVFHRLILEDGSLSKPADFINQPTAQSFLHFGQDPVGLAPRSEATIYTDDVEGTEAFRVIYTPNFNHVMGFFSRQASTCVIDFFEEALGAPKPIPSHNQIWQWKVLFSALGVAGFFIFAYALILVLLDCRFFADLRFNSDVQPLPASPKSKKRLWGGLVAGAVFSIIAYFIAFLAGIVLRPQFFHQERTLVMSYWSIACGLFTLATLCLGYRKISRDSGLDPIARGVRRPIKMVAKSLLLGLIAAVAAYSLVFVLDYLFKTDFRFWFVIVLHAFDADKIPEILKYLPFIAVYYIVQSVAINVFNYIEIGKKEWVNTLVLTIFIILGPLVYLAVGYGYFLTTGLLPLDFAGFGTGSMLFWLYPLIFYLPVFTVVSRMLYKRSGNPYIAGSAFAVVSAITMATNAMSAL